MGLAHGENLSLEYLMKINQIFSDNNWDKDSEEGGIFSRYCMRAGNLPDDECRDLFLELSKRYSKISDDQYKNLIIETIKKVLDENKDVVRCDKIYIFQLLAPKDKGKTKSSARVWYSYQDIDIRMGKYFRKYKVLYASEITNTCVTEVNNGDAFILLVDDYVGTGETAEQAIEPFIEKNVSKDRIIVATLVSQEQGVNYLRSQGYKITAGIVKNRGITDYYNAEESEKKKRVMERIEKELGVSKRFRMGYGQSEALVSMIKTPNNTFPVFWLEKSDTNLAPFTRGNG